MIGSGSTTTFLLPKKVSCENIAELSISIWRFIGAEMYRECAEKF
jgi:hypothetical protein